MSEPVTLRLGASNVYLLPAGHAYLAIDAGPDYAGAWESAVSQMTEAGVRPAAVQHVLVTHGHPDHCALGSSWQREAGARVVCGRDDLEKLRGGGRDPEVIRAAAVDLLVRYGVPVNVVAAARGASGRRDRRGEGSASPRLGNLRSIAPEHRVWPGPLQATPVEPDELMAGADHISLGGLRLQALASPGHTPGSTVFLDEARGDLYTGDHVLEKIAPTPGLHFDSAGARIRSLPQYLRSLAALRPLNPRRVLPGHGAPFVDLGSVIDRTTTVFEQRARRILRKLDAGPATAWEITLRLYPHLRPSALWVMMAEVIGLLDLLEEREQLRRDEDEATVFTPIGSQR